MKFWKPEWNNNGVKKKNIRNLYMILVYLPHKNKIQKAVPF